MENKTFIYDMGDPTRNSEGLTAEDIIEKLKELYLQLKSNSEESVNREELEEQITAYKRDLARIRQFEQGEPTNLVAWDGFSLEVFRLAKEATKPSSMFFQLAKEAEIKAYIARLLDENFLKELGTTAEIAMLRLGILMNDEPNPKILKVLCSAIFPNSKGKSLDLIAYPNYYAKKGFLNPIETSEIVNNFDKAARNEEAKQDKLNQIYNH